MFPNHLNLETSPYLLMHAGNPVDWYPWGEPAFQKSRQEQKPILLSIGYSTCHWCHVMAHESFEDIEIAKVINAHFVAIKVDREERPDLDHIYMTAVTAMTGQGGWPMTVFLTPDAFPFYGGTYFPPVAKWGSPGFRDLLLSIAHAWDHDRLGILTSSQEFTARLKNANHPDPDVSGEAARNFNSGLIDTGVTRMLSQFDSRHGGFGQSPKFPMGHNLSLILGHFYSSKDTKALGVVDKTLMAMARGGIYDHLGGGFHRYSVDEKWHVPHFEKMLYDQALLVLAYAQGYQVTGRPEYAQVARETLDYVLRNMSSPDGGFYGAQDADSVEGVSNDPAAQPQEGAFYVWTYKEILEVLGKTRAGLFCRYYGVCVDGNVGTDPHGDFGGKNILFLARDIEPGDRLELEKAKQELFLHRCQRNRPSLDTKIMTDWNGLMIAAFAFAGGVLGDAKYVSAGRSAAEFVLTRLKRDKKLLHSWCSGEAAIEGMLEDYAFLIFGLEHLYEVTLEHRYLDEAEALTEEMLAIFSDSQYGGFFMTPVDGPPLILRPQEVYDGAIPSGNSIAAYALVKLYLLTGAQRYKTWAEKSFNRFFGLVSQAPQAYTVFLSALDLYLAPPVEITVNGRMDVADIDNLRKMVYTYYIPHKALRRGTAQGSWSVNICRDRICLPPIFDYAALEKVLHMDDKEYHG